MLAAFVLVILGITWWLWIRHEFNQKLIDACHHDYEYVSLYNEGYHWVKMCRYCPFQEPVRDERLLKQLREQDK